MEAPVQEPKFIAVDFYCGAGGTTRGLVDAGGYVVAGVDNDEACRKTYESNNRNTTLDRANPIFLAFDMLPACPEHSDGQQEEALNALKSLITKYRRAAPGIPLMFAICAPCQPFTRFVQRRMTDGRADWRERDRSLLSQTVRFIDELQPEMIISENVAGIERGIHSKVWSEFRQELSKKYHTGTDFVCASNFGVPQYRRRSILLALLKRKEDTEAFDIPVPQAAPGFPVGPTVTVEDAIGHLPRIVAGEKHDSIANHQCRNLADINRKRLRSIKPGEPNWVLEHTKFGDIRLPCHKRLEKRGSRGFGDVYTRMRPNRPSPTITTRFHSISNGRYGHYDVNQVRGLSLREGAALQSFEEDYVFHGNGMDAIARMIGNAVPPKLSKHLACYLYEWWRNPEGVALS